MMNSFCNCKGMVSFVLVHMYFGKRGPCACTMAPGSAPDYVWLTLKYLNQDVGFQCMNISIINYFKTQKTVVETLGMKWVPLKCRHVLLHP